MGNFSKTCRDIWQVIRQNTPQREERTRMREFQRRFNLIKRLENLGDREAEAKVQTEGKSSTGFLLAVFCHENPFVRARVARMLGEISDPRAIDDLVARFTDKNEAVEVREAAGCSLVVIDDQRAIQALISVMISERSDFRWRAAEVLEQMGTPAAKPLVGVLFSKDAFSRGLALSLLRRISGQNLGEEPENWNRWLESQRKEEG